MTTDSLFPFRRDLPPGCTGFGDCDCDVCFPPEDVSPIQITYVARSTPLWFRQSWRNTLWLLTHRWPWDPFWWATLIGLCPYCRRWDCID